MAKTEIAYEFIKLDLKPSLGSENRNENKSKKGKINVHFFEKNKNGTTT